MWIPHIKSVVCDLSNEAVQNKHVNIRCYPLGATACHETTKEVKG